MQPKFTNFSSFNANSVPTNPFFLSASATLAGYASSLSKPLAALIVFILISFSGVRAQAPSIISDIGMPVGNTSSTGLAYGNGKYVTVYSNGSVYTSADGEKWSKVNNPGIPSGKSFRLAFGAGVFVLAGDAGFIFSSPDGITWTSRPSGTTNSISDIQYLQGAFFISAYNRTLLTSLDGINWSPVTIGVGSATDMLMNMTYGAGNFVVGIRRPGYAGVAVYRSATGASNSWSLVEVDAAESLNRIQYLKDRFFIFCSGSKVFTSTDAASWTNSTNALLLTLPDATTQTIGSPNQIFNGIYDGSKFYLFGSSGYYGGNRSIFSSTDGINFTLEPQSANIVGQGSAYLNNKYFQYGNEGLVISTDGLNYSYTGGNYYDLASNGTGYVGVGMVGTSGVIYSSSNFSTWFDHSPAGQKELYGVTYTGSRYFAVGNQAVLSSNDGSSWSQIATPGDVFNTLTHGASRLVATGYDANTFSAKIAWSTDGISWNIANTDNNYYFKVKYVNNQFFALGYSNDAYTGVILHSSNGSSWTDITPNLPFEVYYFNDVIHDGTKYHFMGMEYEVPADFSLKGFFSVATSTLADPNSFSGKGTISTPPGILGGTYGEGAFAYSNGHIVGAVVDIDTNEGFVIYSSDGVSWTAAAVGESTAILGIEASGDVFRLLGTNNAKITVSFNLDPLPVHLTHFSAALVNDQSLLKWQTSSELNAREFRVQHRTDGSNWHTIGTVQAAGESRLLMDYQYWHAAPAEGINYYRLIEVDFDGKEQISKVVHVDRGTQLGLRLYPNPAPDRIFLRTNGSGPATIRFYTAAGRLVLQKTVHGSNNQINLKELPGGLYYVVAEQGGQRLTRQIIRP